MRLRANWSSSLDVLCGQGSFVLQEEFEMQEASSFLREGSTVVRSLPSRVYTCIWLISDCSLLSADISRLKTLKGLALQDIITQIHTYIHRGIYIYIYILF